jgi:large subunit ribosomal protein L25
MKSIEISGTLRTDLGTKYATRLRREGQVPCVIYGNGESTHFSTPTSSFRTLAYTPEAYIVQASVGDKTISCIMHEIQFHPVTDDIIHVDFIELVEGKLTQMEIPLRLLGSARGVRNGGKLKQNLRKLVVKALPKDLPDSIDIDITDLRIGQSIKVEDVKTTGNFELTNSPGAIIVSIKTSRKAVDETVDEDDAEEASTEAEAEA